MVGDLGKDGEGDLHLAARPLGNVEVPVKGAGNQADMFECLLLRQHRKERLGMWAGQGTENAARAVRAVGSHPWVPTPLGTYLPRYPAS